MTTRPVLLSRLAMARDLLARTDLTPSRRDDIEASERRIAKQLGSSPNCRICGRALQADASRALGLGPVCAANHRKVA